MQVIKETIAGLKMGDPAVHERMAMFPLQHSGVGSAERTYLTLDEALQAGVAEVGEVSAGGSVPDLMFRNLGNKPVLLVEGEELVGAKQNRTLNVTILAPPKQDTKIPVTCVEQGRWGYRSGERLRQTDHVQFARSRRSKVEALNLNMSANPTSRRANQGRTWSEIGDKMQVLAVPSTTGAVADIYKQMRKPLDSYVRAFPQQPGQVGAVFFVGTHFAGLDLFAHEATLATLLPKLLRSYALDALELDAREPFKPASDPARQLLDNVAAASSKGYPAVGMGEDVRIESPSVAGGALVVDGSVLHLAAFRREAERASSATGGYRRARARRSVRFSE